MIFVVGEQAGSAIAVIGDFKTGVLQPLDDSSGAQRGRSFLAAGLKRRGARGRADQGNPLRLTDDFDRQSLLLVLCFPECRAGLRLVTFRSAHFPIPMRAPKYLPARRSCD